MMGLWADGWFYISSAGLLVSGILFFFLLGQYRVASEAADVTEAAEAPEAEARDASPIRPVYIPDEEPAQQQVVSHSPREPEAAPKPEAKPKAETEAPAERRRDPANTTGGISPAVVYLQNIKIELADLHKDLRGLVKRVDDELSSVAARDEALIDRLGELTRAVESLKAAAAVAAPDAAAPSPAPKKARKAEKSPEPVVAEPAVDAVVEASPLPAAEPEPEPAPAPRPAPITEPIVSSEETIRMDLSALVAPLPAEPAPAETPKLEASPEEKPRRGPVWPV